MTQTMTVDELKQFLARDFPQVRDQFSIKSLTQSGILIELIVKNEHLRPGGTVSGPTMFALADIGVYLAILSRIGPKALAVTTNCSIDFMRKPAADKNLIAEVKLLKLGRVLAVGDVLITSEGDDRPVARATLTYSIPPE